jgi:hypothetical protein
MMSCDLRIYWSQVPRSRGAKRMADDDLALGQSLGPRGPHEVLPNRLEHLVARQADVERRVQDGERDPRPRSSSGRTGRGPPTARRTRGTAAMQLDDHEEDEEQPGHGFMSFRGRTSAKVEVLHHGRDSLDTGACRRHRPTAASGAALRRR